MILYVLKSTNHKWFTYLVEFYIHAPVLFNLSHLLQISDEMLCKHHIYLLHDSSTRMVRESDFSPASACFMLYIKRPRVHKNSININHGP